MPSSKDRPKIKSHILLGMKVDIGAIKNIRIENFSLDNEVKALKEEASKRSNNPVEILELIYHGKVLDNAKCLKDYGIKSGEMVHVFKQVQKPDKAVVESKTKLTASSINMLFKTYGLPSRSVTSFSNAMEIFGEAATIEKILELEPGMAQDPVALSYLTAPELVYHLQDPETFENVMRKHPLLVPTFVKVIKSQMQCALHLGQHSMTDIPMDSDDDDDVDAGGDDDGEEDEEGGSARGLITSEQLSAALAMAGAAAGASVGPHQPGTSAASQDTGFREFLGSLLAVESPSAEATTSRPLITTDMFSNALSQAISSVSSDNPGAGGALATTAPDAAVLTPEVSSTPDYTAQLTSLQEMGLDNHRLNIRALNICSGDVQAAIHLILSGLIPDA